MTEFDEPITRYETERAALLDRLHWIEPVLRCLRMAAMVTEAEALTAAALDRAREAVALDRGRAN